MNRRTGKIYSLNRDEFIDIVNNSSTLKQILKTLGLSFRGHSYDVLNQRMKEEGIVFNNLERKHHTIYKDIKCVLIENSPYVSTNNLKKRLIECGILKNECVICNQQPIHNNMYLCLQLDHINGIHNDNRLDNLRSKAYRH